MRRADGSRDEVAIGEGMQPNAAARRLFFSKLSPTTNGDLFQLLLPPGDEAPGTPELVEQLPIHEWEPALSPDGALLANSRGDFGQSEVVLRTYPTQAGQWQVSRQAAAMPCGAGAATSSTIATSAATSCA